MAATDRGIGRVRGAAGRLLKALLGVAGGLAAHPQAQAVDLPEDRAEALLHVYSGGGVRASGPALLIRKSVADKVSLSASTYVDMVSSASVDVVTSASPYKETRHEYSLGATVAHRDTLITVGGSSSREPDYTANAINVDATQEVFGGMTTVSLGFTKGSDKVGKRYDPAFSDTASHWRYRVGVTQILSPTWLASANAEIVSDAGYLGSPYRVARVFGAFVPERDPRTRTSRSLRLRVIGDVGSRTSVNAAYRYFWDTWGIRNHTVDLGASRWFGDRWLADAGLRVVSQHRAVFYTDNATEERTYVTRNRQLGSFRNVGLGAKAAYTVKAIPGRYEVKAHGAYELTSFSFSDYTDLRTGSLYRYRAHVLQAFVTATF